MLHHLLADPLQGGGEGEKRRRGKGHFYICSRYQRVLAAPNSRWAQAPLTPLFRERGGGRTNDPTVRGAYIDADISKGGRRTSRGVASANDIYRGERGRKGGRGAIPSPVLNRL